MRLSKELVHACFHLLNTYYILVLGTRIGGGDTKINNTVTQRTHSLTVEADKSILSVQCDKYYDRNITCYRKKRKDFK